MMKMEATVNPDLLVVDLLKDYVGELQCLTPLCHLSGARVASSSWFQLSLVF